MKLNKTDLENKPEHCLTRPKWGNTSALLRVSSDQFATSASPKATSGLRACLDVKIFGEKFLYHFSLLFGKICLTMD
jgi:hypothetical protein